MSQKKENTWLSLADLQQVVSKDPEVRKVREEEARVKREQKNLLIGQAREVLDSRAALTDVINYINREHKQGTLDYGEVNDLLVMDPICLVRTARQ